MRTGDLIRIARCGVDCFCWFCINESNRIGLVLNVVDGRRHILFDIGEWDIFPHEIARGIAEVISENR